MVNDEHERQNNNLESRSLCGFVAIIGRPNVGKSTLLNKILGQKLSITSHKPQTTRHQILGIKTEKNTQTIYVDTPGLHRKTQHQLNRYMNKAALQTLEMVDVIIWMIEALYWTAEDEWIWQKIKKLSQPVILLVNKVDKISNKELLLPFLKTTAEKVSVKEIVPLSAQSGSNIAQLEQTIMSYLPENPFYFPAEQLTDRSERFLASEIIREKLMRYLHKEIPYSLTVEIEQFELKNDILHISAIIWLERDGQKAIVIGEKGEQLKKIGRLARLNMEKLFGKKVFLRLWTKVKTGWSDDQRALQNLGYG